MPARDKGPDTIRKCGDLAKRPIHTQPMHEGGSKRIARSDRVCHLDGAASFLDIVVVSQKGASTRAQRHSDGSPAITSRAIAAKSFGRRRQTAELLHPDQLFFVELYDVSTFQ